MKTMCLILPLVLVLLIGTAAGVSSGISVTGFDVFFPQVAQGVSGGVSIETVLTVSNPHAEGTNVCLQSFNIDLMGTAAFRLRPFQTRQIVFRGGSLQIGWVRVISDRVVGASVRITTRPDEQSSEVLTTISILGQPLTSRVLVPILRNRPEADNTGIAIAYLQEGGLRFSLYDDGGELQASREERRGFTPGGQLSDQTAFLITDLFPNLGDFESGTLLIEHIDPVDIAEAFAVTALYLREGQFGAAEVTNVDDIREFLIITAGALDPGEVAPVLAETYGFELEQTFPTSALGLMTIETARAVARDVRVQDVRPNSAGPFF